jgi:hypothetical protein
MELKICQNPYFTSHCDKTVNLERADMRKENQKNRTFIPSLSYFLTLYQCFLLTAESRCITLQQCHFFHVKTYHSVINEMRSHICLYQVQGGSNKTGTELCVNKPHCAAAVRPWESRAITSTLPPARVRTCSDLFGSC